MGSLSTVFSAKVMAIVRCTELLLTENLMRRIHICSDSRAAVVALAKTTTESSLIWECMQVLGKLSEFNKVTLVWITGPTRRQTDWPRKELLKSHLTSLLLYPLV